MAAVLDFCTPAVPGESHTYYGYSHNKYIKLPHVNPIPVISSPSLKQHRSKEHKTLRSVALSGNLALLKQFLQMVPDQLKAVNDPHPATGLTCLHFAASRGHLKIITCLVEEYAVRVDSTDKEGETALLKAAYNGHYHVVEYLLDTDANIHQKDKDGWTALHNACSRGYFRIVRLLVDRKAKVDVRSKMGHTPLINAASKGYMSIVEYLLDEARANPLIKNNFGEAAYDVSAAAGESYICEMLEKAGRKWWHLQHTEGVLNPGNKRASMFGATYDLLEFHVTVIVILHENQRSTSLLGLSRPQFSETYLTKSDTRGPWSDHATGDPMSKEMVSLPATSTNNHRISNLSNWFWLTDWQIDYSDPRVDPTSGWQYAKSFNEDDAAWTPVAPTSGYNWVRRRRWVRVMKRRMDLTKGSHRGESVTIANMDEENEDEQVPVNDYLLQADIIIQTVKSDASAEFDGDTDIEILREDLQKYNQAVEILTDSMKTDENEFRKHQASTLVRSYMAHIDRLNNKVLNMVPSGEPVNVTQQQQGSRRELGPNGELHENMNNPWVVNQDWAPRMDIFGQEASKYEWESDNVAKTCRVCVKKFGFLLRRHHCRKCGLVVCDKCSPWKVFLNSTDILQDPEGTLESSSVLASQLQRVCEKCYFNQEQQ
ncbi:hypothetical protein EDC94DRAFT_549272 [Helicostylum pulchrum]|uniref:FYVE-type domain-containing protein n=1 Tax=Helicostylum pulchrum TaxID=562976 RepID=A0ABP9YGX7_9FUNG|nr:hypothetical protein EDC94DRAFT_549272 [Helicostylum pulchrum]